MKKPSPCAAECRRQLSAAIQLALAGKYLDAALEVYGVRPKYGRRLLFMAAGKPLKGYQDYWAEPCAWDFFGKDTPPIVIVEMQGELAELRRTLKMTRQFLYREKKRAVKAAFKEEA